MPDKPRYDGIPLDIALDNIATAFDLDTDTLIAAEDTVGGYHASHDDGFPIGSMWRVEGQVLHALVRATQPFNVVEFGTSRGCSATHFLEAMRYNENECHLDCVDNGSQVQVIGDLIPPYFAGNYEIHNMDMEAFIAAAPDASYDLILEDGMHDPEQVEMVWRAAYRLLRPGGIILSHDAEHFIVGERVREGIARAGYFGAVPPARTVLIAPSDCGYAYWRKPLEETDGELVDAPKPKRKRTAKKT
jgi:hypothetical protein